MLYNLPTGKTIELTIDQFLQMTDEDLEYLVATNQGHEINDPFFSSQIKEDDTLIREYIDTPFPPALLDDDFTDEDFIPDDI